MSDKLACLADLIKNRRSIRSFKKDQVPEGQLLEAIELASWAANAGNKQNWYFYIIVNPKIIRKIAETYQSTYDEIENYPEARALANLPTKPAKVAFFKDAPALIAVTVSRYQSRADQILEAREKVDPQARKMRDWRNISNSSIQTIGSVITNLILILHAMGIGSVWMGGPIVCRGMIDELIKIPSDRNLVALVAAGYADEKPPVSSRRPVAEICQFIR